MPKPVSVRHLVLTAALAAAGLSLALAPVVSIAPEANAQDAFDLSVPKEDLEAAPAPNMDCAAEHLSGSGPGFASSRRRVRRRRDRGLDGKSESRLPGSELGQCGGVKSVLRGAGALLEMFRRRHSLQAERRRRRSGREERVAPIEIRGREEQGKVCVGSTHGERQSQATAILNRGTPTH